MNAKDVIKNGINMAHMVTTEYLSDLNDAELLTRPCDGANHIAWQLGHLIESERQMISALGHPMPAVPADFVEKHSKETATSNDAKKFHKKEEYLKLMSQMHEATFAALDKTPDADLDKPGPEAMRAYAPTVGAVFAMIGNHEMMHVGQFAATRRKLGKPVKI